MKGKQRFGRDSRVVDKVADRNRPEALRMLALAEAGWVRLSASQVKRFKKLVRGT